MNSTISIDGLPEFNLPVHGFDKFIEDDNEDDATYNQKLKCNTIILCEVCNTAMSRKDAQCCICYTCGLEYDIELIDSESYSGDILHSYNATDNSHVAFKIVGSCKSAHAQNVKLMGMTSEYNIVRTRRILQKINAWIYQIEGDTIPSSVCRDTAETYSKLQESEFLVKRAGGLNGVLASLLYNKCIEHGVPKKPKIIASITGIQDNQLSDGDRILRQMANKGVLKIPDGYGEYTDFIDQYFEKLDINEHANYKQFVIDLIEVSDVSYIKIGTNSARPTTRCAGCIFILCQQLKLHISRDRIAEECNISKSTFARFVNMIEEYKNKKFIKDVFIKHSIPRL